MIWGMHSRFIQLLEHLIYLTDYCKDRRPDRATCRNVSAEFNSAPELSCAILNMILLSDEDGLSNVRLLFIVRLLGFLKKNIDAITMSLQDVASTPELDRFFWLIWISDETGTSCSSVSTSTAYSCSCDVRSAPYFDYEAHYWWIMFTVEIDFTARAPSPRLFTINKCLQGK